MFRYSPLLMAALLIAGLIGCSRTNEQTAKVEPSTNKEAAKADLSAAEENWKSAAEEWQRATHNRAADSADYDVGVALEFGPNNRASTNRFLAAPVEGALRFSADIEAAMLGEAAVAPAIRLENSGPFEEPVLKPSGPERTLEELFESQSKE